MTRQLALYVSARARSVEVNVFTAKLLSFHNSRKIEIRVLDVYSANMIRLEELGGTAVG